MVENWKVDRLKIFMLTIDRLKSVMPGQSADWYRRIAAEIDAGKMPMPSLEPPSDGTYSYSKADLNPIHRTEVFKSPEPKPKPTTVTISDRLVKLCNNNRATAERLVTHNLQQNPGKTAQWANEKAVWDLERDRGAR
jgi:hypothetical protein